MNDETLYPKSKFRMCVTTLRKRDGEDETGFEVVDSKWMNYSGKRFREDFFESRENGENLTIEIVNQKPEKFKINQIYMLATRDVVWIWTEEGGEESA